jgi:Helix-turn-helix of DDE superfamily endonuclease
VLKSCITLRYDACGFKAMRWKNLPSNLSNGQFQRLTGVKRSTFEKMCFVIKATKEQRRKHANRGKVPKLCVEDQLLMMLMYNREYRTFMHIAADYLISESQCWRIVKDIEDILIQSKAFSLPGKKELTKSTVRWEVVLIDVGESPIERPKKNSAPITQGKRKSIPTKHS